MKRLALLALLVSGCGMFHPRPWDQSAHIALNAAAHALVAADAAATVAFTHDMEGVDSLPKYLQVEARYAPVARVMRVAKFSLLAAEQAVTTWERVHDAASACKAHEAMILAVEDERAVLALMRGAGVALPPGLAPAIEAVTRVAASVVECSQ